MVGKLGKLFGVLVIFVFLVSGTGFSANTVLQHDDGGQESQFATNGQFAVKFNATHKGIIKGVSLFVEKNGKKSWDALLHYPNHTAFSSTIAGADAPNSGSAWRSTGAFNIVHIGEFYAVIPVGTPGVKIGKDTSSASAGKSETNLGGTWVAESSNLMIRTDINYLPEASAITSSTNVTSSTISATCTEFDPGEYISEAKIQLDGTNYSANATDGTFNSATEAIRRSFTGLSVGTHSVKVWCKDSSNNWGDELAGTAYVDSIPPVLTYVHIASNNSNTAYAKTGDTVTVSFTANESLQSATVTIAGHSATVSGSGASRTAEYTLTGTDSEGTVSFSISYSDLAGNAGTTGTSTTDSSAVLFDRTAPSITYTWTPTPNANNWNNADVTIDFSCTDSGSGLATCTGDDIFGEGSGHSAYSTATDNAGNSAYLEVSGIDVDKTAPILSASRSPVSANANGWNNVSVTVSFSCTEELSGLDGDCPSDVVFGEGSAQSTSKTIYDLAGNSATAGISEINVDLTLPEITGGPTTEPNEFGWYTNDVIVHFEASDALSGIYSVTPDQTISTSGSGIIVEGIATDNAGNQKSTGLLVEINVDKDAPTTSDDASPYVYGTWSTTDVTLTLTPADGTSGVASTKYCIDVANTCSPDTEYSEPVTFDEDGIWYFRYQSWDDAGNSQGIVSRKIMIDKTLPESEAEFSGTLGTNGWYVSSVSATLSATDATSGVDTIDYYVDSGSFAEYAGSFPISADGTHTVYHRATDVAGNVELTKEAAVKMDTESPSTEESLSGTLGENGWYVSAVSVTLSADDGTSGIYKTFVKVDSGSWTEYDGEFSVSSEGAHTVSFYSVDNAGNTEGIGSTIFSIDTGNPTAPIISGSDYFDGDGAFTISWSASEDQSEIDYYLVDVTVNGEYLETLTTDGTSVYFDSESTLDDTEYSFAVSAVDMAGHESESSGTRTVTVDKTGPFAPILSALPQYTTSNAVTVSWSAVSDPGDYPSGVSAYSVYVNSAFETNLTSLDLSYEKTSLDEGTEYGFKANAWDSAEPKNEGGFSDAETTTIDTIAPETTHEISPVEPDGLAGWYVGAPAITLAPSDATSGIFKTYYQMNGGGFFEYTTPFSGIDGENSIDYYSVDNAGNVEEAESFSFKVDLTNPEEQSIVLGDGESYYLTSSNVSATFSTGGDEPSGVEYCVIDWGDDSSETVYPEEAALFHEYSEGAHSAQITCYDNSGRSSFSDSNSVFVDTIAPEITGGPTTEPNENGWYASGVEVAFECSDSGSGVETEGFSVSFDYEGEDQSTTGTCADLAGNSADLEVGGINIDLTNPYTSSSLLPVSPNGEDGWYSTPVQVTLYPTDSEFEIGSLGLEFSGSGVNKTLYCIGDLSLVPTIFVPTCVPNETYTGPFNVTAQGAGLYVAYYSVDNAGNEEYVRRTAYFSIDSVAPESEIAFPIEGAEYSLSSMNVTGTSSDSTSGVSLVEIKIVKEDNNSVELDWTAAEGTVAWNYSNWTPSGYGTYKIYSRALDYSGLYEPEPSMIRVFVPAPPLPETTTTIPTYSGYKPTCGNGQCNANIGENWLTCPVDCAAPSDNNPFGDANGFSQVTTTTILPVETTTTVAPVQGTMNPRPGTIPTGQFLLFQNFDSFWSWLPLLFLLLAGVGTYVYLRRKKL